MLAMRMLPVVGLTMLLAWQSPVWADVSSALPRAPLVIHVEDESYRLEVELARTAAERRRGLMDRDHLAEDGGMLFLYDEPQSAQAGFWMYRTRIALDIAFLDAEGIVVAVHTMQPCTSSNPYDCPVTVAGADYHAALEVNAGYFEARGIEEGACIIWSGRQGGCRSTP
ncbi:DUF192 domain-containing protein [Billgrantia antri]|uniref:DUF192 domain-containing protein n=1 Tax=Billgrantia antri TaxID=2846777 RepID=UPI003B20E2D7